jgi:iron complex outermembrane recepter protein
MKRSNRLLFTAGLLAAPVFLVFAQTTVPVDSSTEDIINMDPFVISSKGDVGYGVTHTSGATRINTPILDTPASVTTLNEKFLQDIAPIEPLDAMKYVSGVTYSGNPMSGSYTIRGYQSTQTYRDGLRDYYGVMSDDSFSTERMELIKGPEGVLFGSIDVGGVLNRVSKVAKPGKFTTVSVSAGNNDFIRSEIDHNQNFADGKVGVRLAGVLQDGETYVGGPYDRTGLFGYVSWRPNPATTVWTRFEHRTSNIDVTQSTYFTNSLSQLPTFLPQNVTSEEPWSNADFRLNTYELGVKNQLSSDWSARALVRASALDKYEERLIKTRIDFFDRNGVNLGREIPSGGRPAVNFNDHENFGSIRMGRQRYINENYNGGLVGAFDLVGNLELFGMKHKFFSYLGAETVRTENKTTVFSYSSFDFLAPLYNDTPESKSGPPSVSGDTIADTTNINIGMQDNVYLLDERLIFSAGARYDYSISDVHNAVGNKYSDDENSGWSSKLGLVGKVTNDVSLFYNYTTTFLAQGGVDHNNRPFDNLKGVMNDLGVKWSLLKGTFTGTASYFGSRLKNQILSGDTLPNGTQEQVQLGVNKTDGWETDLRWQPIPAWSLLVGYGDLTSLNEDGIRIRHVPQGPNYQIFSKYDFLKGPIKGLYVGLGYVYTNERSGDNSDSFNLPSHGVYDLIAGYQRDNWRLQLNIKNLTDEIYIATGGSPRRSVVGEYRNIRMTFTYTF